MKATDTLETLANKIIELWTGQAGKGYVMECPEEMHEEIVRLVREGFAAFNDETRMSEETPWKVHCIYGGCGGQFLTKKAYDAQMMRPDSIWLCPVCGMDAEWDDVHHERVLEKSYERETAATAEDSINSVLDADFS